MRTFINDWIIRIGIAENIADYVSHAILILVIVLAIYISDLITNRILIKGLGLAVKKIRYKWDDVLYEKKVFNRIAHLVPALIVYLLTPVAFPESPVIAVILRHGALVYMILITVLVLYSFLDAVYEIYNTYEISKQIPLKGFLQAAKIIAIIVAFISILSALTNKTPIYFLSGLGALTAITMLVFKDAILGFVAGIQLSANNMVRPGDWIEMPQFGADGDVIDVSLTTVKVQNWDKTISSIPSYALISQSFKNWRGMQESGGRRIKRALYIDMTSVTFCDEELLERLSKIELIKDYLGRKKKEIEEWNREMKVNGSSLVNGRRLTNLGTFRAYVEAYLHSHPKINDTMTFLVRQLKPTDHGIPLEIYVFSKDQIWANYEAIQSDIFDHLLAVLPHFDLRVFQNPTGADFRHFNT
jgi:miniconductance mechanosensitive channel